MPLTINLSGNGAQAAFKEFDGPNGTGNVVPPVGLVVFSSDNTAVATVDQTGKITPVAAGTANISAVDQGNTLTAKDILTVTDTAVSATLTLATLKREGETPSFCQIQWTLNNESIVLRLLKEQHDV